MVSRRLSIPHKFLADICSQVKIRVVLVVGSCMNSQKRCRGRGRGRGSVARYGRA
jgi:hypothetical protein